MSIPSVLVLPYPAQGHVNPMMILSQKLVENGCKVVFVNSEFNHKRVVSCMGEQPDEESLIKLVSIPDGLEPDDDRMNWGTLCDAILRTMPDALEKLIIEDNKNMHLKGDKIRFIVADASMGWALNVACKFGIKGTLFFPASAAMFVLICNIPTLIHDGIINSDGSLLTTKKTIELSPGMPEMDTGTFFWLNLGDTVNVRSIINYMQACVQALNLSEQWFCNTTYELEPKVLNCVPKILPIGPLFRSYGNRNEPTRSLGQFWEEDLSCLTWLDQQPHCSVTYVAFGSITLFDQNQFNELALGLDLTNKPFLWVVREDNRMAYPNEFLGHKGKIVQWAPQQKVLNHPAIASFVSHCGWNSTMEGLCYGVPFLCWPYFADQIYNKVYICDELSVGLGLDMDENGVVSRWEMKKKLDQLLSDVKIRTKSLKLKENVKKENQTGKGRSLENLSKLVKWLKE